MRLPIHTTDEADAHIRQIDDWWRRNRLGSPNLFAEELAETFEMIGSAPFSGHPYRSLELSDARRILLRRTGFYVYYVPAQSEVLIVAVWHARRGSGPLLLI